MIKRWRRNELLFRNFDIFLRNFCLTFRQVHLYYTPSIDDRFSLCEFFVFFVPGVVNFINHKGHNVNTKKMPNDDKVKYR